MKHICIVGFIFGLLVSQVAQAQSVVEGMNEAQKQQIRDLYAELQQHEKSKGIQPFKKQPTTEELRNRGVTTADELEGQLFYNRVKSEADAYLYGKLYAASKIAGQSTMAQQVIDTQSACSGEATGSTGVGFWAKIGTRSKRCREVQMSLRYSYCMQTVSLMQGGTPQMCDRVIDDSKWAKFWTTMGKGAFGYLISVNGMKLIGQTTAGALNLGATTIDAMRGIQGQQVPTQIIEQPVITEVPGETQIIEVPVLSDPQP